MANAQPSPNSRGLTIHGSLVDTLQFLNGPPAQLSGLSLSNPDIATASAPSPTVYQSSPLRSRSPASIGGWPITSPLARQSGGQYRAADIKAILETNLAFLSGGRDHEGRTIVTIPALEKGAERPREELTCTLYYLVNTVSEEVRENGFAMILDGRGYSWQSVKQTLKMLQDCLPSQIHVVYIIQQGGQFWRRQGSFSRHSREKSRFEFSTIMLSSADKLLRHIEESQLTSGLGGFLPYNHRDWITFRLNLEQFIVEVESLLDHMIHLEHHMMKEHIVEDVEGAEQVLHHHENLEEELKMCAQDVLKEGRDLIGSIEHKPDDLGTSSITPDKINATATVRQMLEAVQRRQRQIEEVWRSRKIQLEQNLQLKIFERAVFKVKSWLKGRGMESLSSKQDIGESLAAVDVLWQQYEKLESKAQSIYDNLTQLRMMVDKLCGNNHFASTDMRQCVTKLTNRYTFFEARLRERGNILRLSMAFHRHLEKWRQDCEFCQEEVMKDGMPFDDTMATQDQQQMDNLRESGRQVIQEGRGLLEMMHQQSELQMPHPPEYKKGSRHVRHCLDEVEDKKKRVEQLAEARKVRQDQLKQIYTCEKDAKQALDDLENLLEQLSSCLGNLGDSLTATTKLREEHTKITRAAKKTHDYGKDLLSAAHKSRQACNMSQQPNQRLVAQLSTTWDSIVTRGNQHTGWLDMLMTFYTRQKEVQQQMSWLQQQLSDQLPSSPEDIKATLTDVEQSGSSTKQTAADTLDLGSDLLDELEQAAHFSTNEAACEVVRQQLEKLSSLTKQHSNIMEECVRRLADGVELRTLEQQANQVIQWMQHAGQPNLTKPVGRDLQASQEQLAQLESKSEAVKEHNKKMEMLIKSVSMVKHNQFSGQLLQVSQGAELRWSNFSRRWQQRQQTLLAAVQYFTTIDHLQHQFELFENDMRLADLPDDADDIEVHLEKTQGDRKELLNIFRQALEDGRSLTEQLIHGDQEDRDLLAAQGINEELDQLDKQRTKLDELWIKTQKYLNQTLQFQQKQQQQAHTSVMSPSEWLGSIAEPFIANMPIGTSSSEADDVIAKLDSYAKQAEGYQKQLGQNRSHVKDALRRVKEELLGRRSLLLQLRLLYSNIERCSRKLDALGDKLDPTAKEKAVQSVSEVLKEWNILLPQLGAFPSNSVKQVETACDRLKEKAGLGRRVSSDRSHRPGSGRRLSRQHKDDIIKQLEAFESASQTFLIKHTDLGESPATAKLLLKQYQQFQDTTEPMIAELERVGQQRSKGEADFSDLYDRLSHATQTCRQAVTKRLAIITSLVDYYNHWQLVQENIRELEQLLKDPFQPHSTLQVSREQLDYYQPVFRKLHESHDHCKSHGKQFLDQAASAKRHGRPHEHSSNLKTMAAASKVKQHTEETSRRVRHVSQGWVERERLLSQCVQGNSVQLDCQKVTEELEQMMVGLGTVDLGDSLEMAEDLLEHHNQCVERVKELQEEVERLVETCDDLIQDEHYDVSSVTGATQAVHTLHKRVQSKMNERQQLMESCGNFFARSMELKQDFEDGIREKTCRPAKLEGFTSRLSALSSEGTSLIAMARGSVGRGPRSEKVKSQGVEDTITTLQHKMEVYKKLERRASVNLTATVTTKKPSANSKRFSMGNFDDYSMLSKLEFIEANPQPAINRLFPKREGICRTGSLRIERPLVHRLSNQFERNSVDDSCKPTPPERIDSFKHLKTRSHASVNSLRQKFEQLTTEGSPSSSMEDLSTSAPKRTFGDESESPSLARRRTPPVERAKTLPLMGSPLSSPSTRRVTSLKIVEERAESPKVSAQAIEMILQSLSTTTESSSKDVGETPAGSRLSQHLHQQLPQLDDSSDDEELNKEMESLAASATSDEPDYSSKEKLKSLNAVTRELVTGEAQYLQSLQCIVDGYIPAWDRPYLPAFLTDKKETIFSNITELFHFQRKFYEDLLGCSGVQEICECFKSHKEGFSLYVVYMKALPEAKKVLSQFGGDFFEMIRKEKRYSRSFVTNYFHPCERISQYLANLKDMLNAAQKEELFSVGIIRDTLKIVQRIDRIAAFSCLIGYPDELDEDKCVLMGDFMVYTAKKKKKKAEEMRVFLHQECVIFTKSTLELPDTKSGSHDAHSTPHHQQNYQYVECIKISCLLLTETVEKGKSQEKFGLAENKAGPDREFILQPVDKSVDIKQEWCTEVKELLTLELNKLKEQAQARSSGIKTSDTLPPPMMHVVELPARFNKHKKTNKRDSDTARGSVASTGSSKHSSIRGSKHDSVRASGNPRDGRHFSIEMPQPVETTSAVTADRIVIYETTEPYDGSGKDGYLTLPKGCQVEVLDRSGDDWLVCTVPEKEDEMEKEGVVPKSILTPLTRPVHRVISKQQSTTSSISKHRYSVYSQKSNISGGSRMSTAPYVDEDLYMIIPSSGPSRVNTNSGIVSGPMQVSNSPRESVQGQQYIYYAVENYHPDKEGYISLTAGEAVEVLDKSNSVEWFITTVATEERPSEEGLVPANILSAEYIPVRYDSLQDEIYISGSDEGGPKQLSPPPPLPPHHPSHDVQSVPEYNKEELLEPPGSDSATGPNKVEDEGGSPQTSTHASKTVMSVMLEESPNDEDSSTEQSDTTPVVSPRGSLHSGSDMSSPVVEKRDQLFGNRDHHTPLLTQSLTAVELTNSFKRRGIVSRLPRYGSDPSLQECVPLSDSSPAYSIPNLASVGLGKSPMHERVSSILRESVMASTRNRHRSTNDYLPKSGSLDRRTQHKSSPVVVELKRSFSRSSSQLSGSADTFSTGSEGKAEDEEGHNGKSLISPKDALDEMRKLQLESVEPSSDANKMEEFDKIEVYVAIADYTPDEDNNIPLHVGQHLQVLDLSREDWWLVLPLATSKKESTNEPLKEGWVPANYLEKLPDQSHDPLMKDNLRDLYNCSFLTDEPTPAQLEGMFSIAHPYMASEAIQGTMPGQLSLYANQMVQVLDSKQDDWWLVVTIATDTVPAIKGWVPAASLVAKCEDDSMSESQKQYLPLWCVRATFQSDEDGMLSIQEGELVIVLDDTNDEWFLARTAQRDPPCEGWVPASYVYQLDSTEGFDIPLDYLEPVDSPWLRPSHHLSQSESSTELEEEEEQLHDLLVSPDLMDGMDTDDRRQVAHEKRMYVIEELLASENDYVEKLCYCIENYVTAVISSVAPKTLYGMKDILFCNMEAIHDFHRNVFLPELEQCGEDYLALASCFVTHAPQLEMYITYCTYQAKSDSVFREYCGFFADLCTQLKDRLQLADYLILPVQRITKYSLLLEDMLKYSIRAGEECDELDAALEVTRGVSVRANNAIHLSMLEIDDKKLKNFGDFVMQEKFVLVDRIEGTRTRPKERRLFLFEHFLVMSKKKRDSSDQEIYVVKESLKLNELSAAQDADSNGQCLILYQMQSGNKYTLHTVSPVIRDTWFHRLQDLISANRVKKESAPRKRSASEPAEPVVRSPLVPKKSVFRRESNKKHASKASQHQHVDGVLSNPGSSMTVDDIEAQPGTQFLVLERIVMEGGDDLQLEPGEVVELVRRENNMTLCVRTLETPDTPAMEGNVPASFLRRKGTHKQSGKFEAVPKITVPPHNQSVSVGSSVTFSSIFNGFPTPSVTWRKGSTTLTSSDKHKITVCSNSTLFEVSNVKFSDAGEYACVVSNSAGTDTATVELHVIGPPDAPSRPTVSKVATTSLKLKWIPPDFDGNSEITTYQVEQLQEGLNEWQPIIQQPKTTFVVKTLEPNTSYQFRITAYNDCGNSPPSEASLTVFTKPVTKGFLISGSPSFKKKVSANLSINSQPDMKGSDDFADLDFLSQQPPTLGNFNTLGLPDLPQSLSQPSTSLSLEDSAFSGTMGSPPPSYIKTTPITTAYDLTLEELGRGRYGIVQKCISKKTEEAVAAKYLRLRTKKRHDIRREAELHQKLLHPHIITFFDAYEAGRNLIVIMEIATGGELLDYIVQTKMLTEAIAVKYISQVISALQYMHDVGVAHMDIRPENILLSTHAEPIVKIIDFGSARNLSHSITPSSYGSPEFCAPEILKKETVNEAVDMWGLGALTFVILSGTSPFFGDNPQITMFRIKDVRLDFNTAAFEQVSQDAKDFINSLLQLNPRHRLSATACQDHPWIKTLNPKGLGVPSWPMAKLDLSRLKTFIARRKWHSSNIAVETSHVFGGRMANMLSRSSLEPSDLQDGVPPSLSGGQDNLVVRAEETVSLSYKVQGNPTPTIQWEHGNKQIAQSARVKITSEGNNVLLTILDVGRHDEGFYTCTALNSLGSTSTQTRLVVHDKPLPPSDLTGVSLGSNSALVSWSRPLHDGNSPVVGYILEHKRVDQDAWAVSADDLHSTAHVVDDLLPGSSYQFRVAAVNAIGNSQFSKPSAIVTVASDPGEEEWDNMETVRVKYTPFENEYSFRNDIAQGSYSMVKLCMEKSTDRLYIAKIIKLDSKQKSQLALHEFDMLSSLSHPRVVTLEAVFQSPTQFVLVMERLSGGELLAHLASKDTLTEEECSHYIRQLLEGLQYIHSCNIIHMAVKPENILLAANCRDIKLVDFRLARYIQAGNQLEAIEGSPEFMAPETVSLKPVTVAADIWSVGVITCIILTGFSPFLAKDQASTIASIQAAKLDGHSSPLSQISHDARDFIVNNLLKKNPRRRLTAAQLLRHRWLQASSRLTLSRSNSVQETGHLKQFVQHRKVLMSQE